MSIDTQTKVKAVKHLEIKHKFVVRPDTVMEDIPEDPFIFDVLLKSLYNETLKLAKPKSESEISVTVRISPYEKFENLEEFKTVQHQKNTAIFNILTKHKIIQSYELEFGTKPTLLKWWGQKTGMYPEIDMPYYKIHCRLIPVDLVDYITDRFAEHKAYYQEVAEVYSRMIKILEEFFSNPTVLNVTLNHFFVSLVEKFNELLESDIRPTLAMEMALPLRNLMLEQEQIARVTKDPNWLFKPMYDHYANLQSFISVYDLNRQQNPNFEQIDQYLKDMKAAREQGLDIEGKPIQKTAGQQTITKVTLIRTETNASIKIILNDEYDRKPIKASLNKAPWRLLLRVAEKEQPLYQSSFDSALDYLNCNTNCKLYSNTGKNLTKILERENGRIVRSVEVEIEAITSQAYQQRKNKLKST
jgi:hypothetical protein